MDRAGLEQMNQAAQEFKYPALVARFAEGLQTYIETSKPYVVDFRPDDSFNDFTRLLSIADIEASKVILVHHEGTYDRSYIDETGQVYAGKWNTELLLIDIADRYASYLEFVNNFVAGAAIEIDGRTIVVLGYELDEQPGICDDCDTEWDTYESKRDYNCGHGIADTREHKHWAIVLDKTDLNQVDWLGGYVNQP